MEGSVWYNVCFWVVFIVSVRSATGGNDPFQGNFPTLKCLKPRNVTRCSGTFLEAYEQTNFSKSDRNINRADTSIFLYTRRNKYYPEFLHECSGLPSDTKFKIGERIIIIIGGYISGVCTLAYFRELKEQLLYRGDYNVILTDWSWGFYPDIFSSFVNAEVVGKQIAFFITLLLKVPGVEVSHFYPIGHSVGAHIAGYVGRYFTELSPGNKISRITGLDPAGAAYSVADDKDILDKSDAVYVDVIHSNAGICFPATIGMYKPTGHADFYVNGGEHQPSCYTGISIMESFMKCDMVRAFASCYPPMCNHFMSIDFYKVSINHCGRLFVAVECESLDFLKGRCRSCGQNGTRCAVMGLDWENCPRKDVPTVYYAYTTAVCPYWDNRHVNLEGYQCEELNTNRCYSPNTNLS